MKLSLKLLMLALAMPLFAIAQDKTADEFKNEGNEFVRNKNYKEALASYEQAITLWGDSVDAATVYAAADCAKRTKSFDTAIKYYDQSIALDYKADYATYYKADIIGDMGNDEEMEKILLEGVEKFKTGKAAVVIKKSLVKYYLKKGLEPYNEAGKILETSATAKPEDYASITANAKEKFVEAKPWVEKVLELDPANVNAAKMMENIKEQLK